MNNFLDPLICWLLNLNILNKNQPYCFVLSFFSEIPALICPMDQENQTDVRWLGYICVLKDIPLRGSLKQKDGHWLGSQVYTSLTLPAGQLTPLSPVN